MKKILSYGAVLWDIIDNNKHLGGAPLNVAVHLAKFGLNTFMLTNLGVDAYGDEALSRIKKSGVKTQYIQRDMDHKTGYTEIILDKSKIAHYKMSEDSSDKHITVPKQVIEDIKLEKFDLIYYGTYCQQGIDSRNTLKWIMKECKFEKVFCDINIRYMNCDREMVKDSLLYADILKLNDEETSFLSNMFYEKELEEEILIKKLKNDFGIEIIIVTKGAKGCTVYEKNDEKTDAWAEKIVAVDTVGAGDAFSAGFIYQLLNGKTIRECAECGNRFGGFVATQNGAIPEYSIETLRIFGGE